MQDKLRICRTTRIKASGALLQTLRNFLAGNNSLSEKAFRDNWLSELRKNDSLFEQGWYMPPPDGLSVLFGTAKRESRVNYNSLRAENMRPKENIFLKNRNDLAYMYASPVDKNTGIMGDFGLTLYFGDNAKVRDHLKRCLETNWQIFDHIKVGMKFSEIYRYAENIISSKGLENKVTSVTDPAGRDIGHTIPAPCSEWSDEEKKIIEESDWEKIKDIISKKRIFVSQSEDLEYKPGMAVTLEPRLVSEDPNIPMASFHTIVIINENGKKELLTNFDQIFKLVGMDYLL